MEHSSYREQAIKNCYVAKFGYEPTLTEIHLTECNISDNPKSDIALLIAKEEQVLAQAQRIEALEGALRELKNAVDECSLGISSREEGVALFTAMEQADELLAADKEVVNDGKA